MGMPGDGEPLNETLPLDDEQLRQLVFWLVRETTAIFNQVKELERLVEDVMEANNLWNGR